MLVGLPFIVMGYFFLQTAGKVEEKYQRSAAWPVVRATLLHVELQTNFSKSGTPMYRVAARYSYSVDDSDYESDRVSWEEGWDSDESWHRSTYERFRTAMEAGEPVNAFVNPDNPSESVLLAESRLPVQAIMFGVGGLFAAVGFGLVIGGVRSLFGGGALRRLRQQFPDEPWKWREDWAAGFARCESRQRASSSLLFAIVWTAVTFVAVLAALFGGRRVEWPAILILVAFAVAGVWMLATALRSLRIARLYGDADFVLAKGPGILGGALSGVVRIKRYIEPEGPVHVELRCSRFIRRRKAARRVTEWMFEMDIDSKTFTPNKDGLLIPLRFLIPYDLPPTGDPFEWSLRVSVKQRDSTVDLHFTVPVFRTPESNPDLTLERVAGQMFESQGSAQP